jgi:cell pole-organizing protein PopZ
MEEILSSIKRIIAEEGESAGKPSSRGAARDRVKQKPRDEQASADTAMATDDSLNAELADGILELTEAVEPEFEGHETGRNVSTADMEGGNMTDTDKVILSDEAAVASRNSLAALSALLIRPDDAPSNTLEGLVRDMLRPMLREWLDANLPELVEKMVAKEIARLTEGRL